MNQQYYIPPRQPANSTGTIAAVLEIVFGLFGMLGIGWIYAGNYLAGIGALIGMWLFTGFEFLIGSITLGFSACLTVPLHIVIIVISGIKAREYAINYNAQGSCLITILIFAGAVMIASFLVAVLGFGLFSICSLPALFDGYAY